MVNSGQNPISEIAFRQAGPGPGLDVMTVTALYDQAPRSFLTAPHRLDFHQVLLVDSGQSAHMADFVSYRCVRGSLLWIRPGQVQRYAPEPMAGRMLLFSAAFPPPDVAALAGAPAGPVHWQLEDPDYETVDALVRLIAAERSRDVVSEPSLRHLLGALLFAVERLPRPDGTVSPVGGELYLRFRRELERRFATTRNADDYARHLRCSARTLSRACLAATGRTAKDLIDERVVLEAKRLLAHTDQPADAIARQLGFSEGTNFGKFFARHAGTTPGEFRRRLA